MTTDNHPITPPESLLRHWQDVIQHGYSPGRIEDMLTEAFQTGADQELEACINHFHEYDTSWGEDSDLIAGLRAARRPKPPSLKEQALDLINSNSPYLDDAAMSVIRRALESLPE